MRNYTKSDNIICLFEKNRFSSVSELEVPELNAVFLALYEKYKSNNMEKGQILEAIHDVMEDTVSNLEKIIHIEYMDRERKDEPKHVKLIPQIVIPGSDLDVKTYLNEETFKKSIKALLEDGILKVNRVRFSATQGEAAIYCNGKKIVQYGDKICFRCKDGNWSDAMAMKEIPDSSLEPGEYGPEIGGYRSINPDHQFVSSAIVLYPKEINQAILGDGKGIINVNQKKPSLNVQMNAAKEKQVNHQNIKSKQQDKTLSL